MKTVLSDSKKITDQGCLTNSLLINYKTNNDISMRSSYHGNVDPVKKSHSCCIIPLARNFKWESSTLGLPNLRSFPE